LQELYKKVAMKIPLKRVKRAAQPYRRNSVESVETVENVALYGTHQLADKPLQPVQSKTTSSEEEDDDDDDESKALLPDGGGSKKRTRRMRRTMYQKICFFRMTVQRERMGSRKGLMSTMLRLMFLCDTSSEVQING
jgi:hypothetical protein